MPTARLSTTDLLGLLRGVTDAQRPATKVADGPYVYSAQVTLPSLSEIGERLTLRTAGQGSTLPLDHPARRARYPATAARLG